MQASNRFLRPRYCQLSSPWACVEGVKGKERSDSGSSREEGEEEEADETEKPQGGRKQSLN